VNLVRFDRIRKSFGEKLVLDNLSLTVDSGEVYGLLGPNGCGKSTAINLLCNLLDPDAGTIQIAGKAVSGDAKCLVGICPQDIALYRDLHPAENLHFFAQIYGLPRPAQERRVSELLQLFGLERFARTRVGALSGGWQRRVHIAVALVHSPAILVLDEPTSAVDLEARHELWKLIDTLKRTGTTILLTTHHLDEAEHLCSRIGVMKNGRIAKEGTGQSHCIGRDPHGRCGASSGARTRLGHPALCRQDRLPATPTGVAQGGRGGPSGHRRVGGQCPARIPRARVSGNRPV
jgi:ABC-2 type transport system ATP-binding protein